MRQLYARIATSLTQQPFIVLLLEIALRGRACTLVVVVKDFEENHIPKNSHHLARDLLSKYLFFRHANNQLRQDVVTTKIKISNFSGVKSPCGQNAGKYRRMQWND